MLTDTELIEEARQARTKAFAPYSEYPVGAALLCGDTVYHGANVEVSGRSTSVHAEMMSVFSAVMAGERSFDTLAVSPDGQTGVAICGLCQHTVAQFTDNILILEDTGDGFEEYQLSDLIGSAYSPNTRHPNTIGNQ